MANWTTGRESAKFMLRLPDGMRERIAEEAKANNRSMNAEIVARLQASMDQKAPNPTQVFADPDAMAKAEDLAQRIVETAQAHVEAVIQARYDSMPSEILKELQNNLKPEDNKARKSLEKYGYDDNAQTKSSAF